MRALLPLRRFQDGSKPLASEAFVVQGGAAPSFPTALAVAALCLGGHATPSMPCFALGLDDGGVDVHRLGPGTTARQGAEEEGDSGAAARAGLAALNELLGFVGLPWQRA